MQDKVYDAAQILAAIKEGLIPPNTGDFSISYSLVQEVALLKITDKIAFKELKPRKQRSLLRLYFRMAALNLLKYRDSIKQCRSREGFVYVMQDAAQPKFLKVGKSIEPNRRLDEANCFSPLNTFSILRWYYSEDAYTLEKLVHKNFANSRLTGEWFDLSIDTLDNFIKAQIYAPLAKLDKARSF